MKTKTIMQTTPAVRLGVSIAAILAVSSAASAQVALTRSMFSASAGHTSTADTAIQSTLGIDTAGPVGGGAGGGAAIFAGFWLPPDNVPPVCPADFNNDGSLDPDDLSDYIACYFSTPQCDRVDFNNSGQSDGDDLSDYITAYFTGCS